MKIDLLGIHEAAGKKAETKIGPGIELAGCPDKLLMDRAVGLRPTGQPRAAVPT
jgi:hypothetical protein